MNSLSPIKIEPTGHPKPLLKQIEIVLNCFPTESVDCPVSIIALKSRAPSKWSGNSNGNALGLNLIYFFTIPNSTTSLIARVFNSTKDVLE
jgi:hypothetical protein